MTVNNPTALAKVLEEDFEYKALYHSETINNVLEALNNDMHGDEQQSKYRKVAIDVAKQAVNRYFSKLMPETLTENDKKPFEFELLNPYKTETDYNTIRIGSPADRLIALYIKRAIDKMNTSDVIDISKFVASMTELKLNALYEVISTIKNISTNGRDKIAEYLGFENVHNMDIVNKVNEMYSALEKVEESLGVLKTTNIVFEGIGNTKDFAAIIDYYNKAVERYTLISTIYGELHAIYTNNIVHPAIIKLIDIVKHHTENNTVPDDSVIETAESAYEFLEELKDVTGQVIEKVGGFISNDVENIVTMANFISYVDKNYVAAVKD